MLRFETCWRQSQACSALRARHGSCCSRAERVTFPANGRLSWNYLPCPPRGGAGRIRGFLATFDCQQCESDTRFVSYFKPNSSLKWRNLNIWRSMSYVLSASEWSYTVTIRITVALLNGPMCSRFFSLRWLRLFAINVKWNYELQCVCACKCVRVMYKYLVVLCLLCIINSSSRCFNTNCVTYGHLVLFTVVDWAQNTN